MKGTGLPSSAAATPSNSPFNSSLTRSAAQLDAAPCADKPLSFSCLADISSRGAHLAVDGLVEDRVEGIGVELEPGLELRSKDSVRKVGHPSPSDTWQTGNRQGGRTWWRKVVLRRGVVLSISDDSHAPSNLNTDYSCQFQQR